MGITRFRRPGARNSTGESAGDSAPAWEETVDHEIVHVFRPTRLFGVPRPGRYAGVLARRHPGATPGCCARTDVLGRCDGIQDHSSLLRNVGRPVVAVWNTWWHRGVVVVGSFFGDRRCYQTSAPRLGAQTYRLVGLHRPDGPGVIVRPTFMVGARPWSGATERGSEADERRSEDQGLIGLRPCDAGGGAIYPAHPAAEAALPVGNMSIDFPSGIRGSEASR